MPRHTLIWGLRTVKKRMYEEQVREYKKAIAINPKYAKAYKNLESIYREKGMKEDADKELSKYNDLVKH